MILISGQTGSGKTTVCKELKNLNCYIVPTYTTRPPRENDDYTICVSNDKFYQMVRDGSFISYHMYDSKMGKVSYGIPTIEYNNNRRPLSNFPPVIITTYDYMNDILKYAKLYGDEPTFKVFISVDDKTIIRKSLNDKNRNSSNVDLLNRLERDRYKNTELKKISDLVITNYKMEITPQKIAYTIITKYREYLNSLIKGGKTI